MMWRFKPFTHKEQGGVEGRCMDVGNLKIQIRNAIAEGGFSCVYLARDAVHVSKQYALKHIICNDEESLDLVMKEISVMKALRGHPNIVTLSAHTILDMGRTKEAFLVMEFCERSLVNVLESRGSGYFDEKQVLLIFRDICNAVFAMHSQSPPIAHRDLKAENLLLSADGTWKLCDFGSTSTNHKRFEKPEEMGIEEDNIRKHTTPAYRSPEMWDLFRREVINEKVDIWALGCLLFRICYFKSAFDGESKLQILNGNYRIPELPKYSTSVTDLIRDTLQASPDDRPDITQVWFRVNEHLPEALQKSLPDRPPEMHSTDIHEGKSTPMPRRSPPPPPSADKSVGQLGAFWSTQHAKESEPKLNEEPGTTNHERIRHEEAQTHGPSKDESFNTFVAEFDTRKLSSDKNSSALEMEVGRLKEQLKEANLEKAEITSKFEKLSAICRSQRQEIQELKQAVAAATPSPIKPLQRDKVEENTKMWLPFGEESKTQPPAMSNAAKSVRTRNGQQHKTGFDSWGFGTESFSAMPGGTSSSQIPNGNNSQPAKMVDSKPGSQPAGWAGF